jgi:hypothetical protein
MKQGWNNIQEVKESTCFRCAKTVYLNDRKVWDDRGCLLPHPTKCVKYTSFADFVELSDRIESKLDTLLEMIEVLQKR